MFLQRRRTAQFEQARGEVDGEHLRLDDLRLGGRREAGIAHDLHDADAGFVGGALVHHAVLAVEDAVVAHEDDDGVVQFAALLEQFVEPAHAVVHGEERAPVGAGHGLEILDGLGRVVGELLAPVEERAVDAVPGVEPLPDPAGFVVEHEGGFGIGDADVLEGLLVFRLGKVEAVRRLVADHEAPGLVRSRGRLSHSSARSVTTVV